MIADIFNFAKTRAVFRGGPKRFGAHPGFPCFCGDRRWLVGFRRGHRNRAIITLFRMLENCYQKELPEAGCDEAGRGCLAGPVFAAAVMLPPDFSHPLLNDSKQMTARQRDLLRAIVEREALAWVVKAVSAERIDQINILNASFEGMSLAVAELPTGISGDRWQPVPHDARHSVSLHRQGGRQICGYCRRVGAGQDPPRRIYGAPRRGFSRIRLGAQQRLSDPRTSPGDPSLRAYASPPADVQCRDRPVGAVLTPLVRNSAMPSPPGLK